MNLPSELTDARVLVIDDDADSIAVPTHLLRSAGVGGVRATQDPREGVELLASYAPDLVLLGLPMAHPDGLRILEVLTAPGQATFVPLLVVTGDTSPPAHQRALALASGLLTKPYEPRQLLDEAVGLLRLRRGLAAPARELAAESRPDRTHAAERDDARARIHAVLARAAIRCAYQPIFELPTRRLLGVEALARFPDAPGRAPAEWFADATCADLRVELELLAVRTALQAVPNLPGDAFLAINLSPSTLTAPELAPLVVPYADRLVLELTETQPVQDYTTLSHSVEELRATGLRFAVDDAGAGYASMRHILRLTPNVIKLDVSITRDIDTDPAKRALTAALVTFAAAIDAHLVAEGIETPGELSALSTLRVAAGQGFYLGRPGPLSPVHLALTG